MRTLRLVAPLLAISSTVAFAQPVTLLRGDDLSRGLTLPPTTAALVDEATASLVNPAGLLHLRGPQLLYLHDRNVDRNLVIDGVFLGHTFSDAVGVGLGFEWVRSSSFAQIERRRTTWGLSLGSPVFSLGASLGLYASDNAFLDQAASLDLGVMSRPNDWLSIGLGIRNVNEPRERLAPGSPGAPLLLDRSYEFAVGVRPIGERLTLSAGYLFTDDTFTRGRLQYVLQGEPLRGLVLGAGFSHGLDPTNDLGLQLTAAVNLPHFGVTYAGGGTGNGLDHVIQARLSGAAYSGFEPGKAIALIDVPASLTRETTILGGGEADPWLQLTQLLVQAERDPHLSGVVLKIEQLQDFGLGRAEELRQAIGRLQRSGKKVVSILFTAGDAEYFAAAASDEIFAVPQAMLLVNGLSASVTFFGEGSDKLGVKWDVARVGRYKNAPDQFTRADMSPEQREVLNAYLDDQFAHLVDGIAQMRKLSPEQVKGALDQGLLTPKQAVSLKLVDAVIEPSELEDKLKAAIPGGRFAGEYKRKAPDHVRWGRAPAIAIVPVIGTIATGKSRQDPFGLAEVAGAESVVRALERASADPLVKAIVLRIDSGGGDALASDLMYRAVLEAKKKKPVIASMGNVAASGGYYAAMGAQTIYADPTTLTGSIGVFILKPAVQPLAEKLGIRNETIERGEQASLFNTFEPWTPDEQAAAQRWVDGFYDDFITEVSKSRSLPKEQVDAIAQGRVWSGTAAKERKLVDELGTLLDAVDAARNRAGITAGEDVELRIYDETSGLLAGAADSPFVREALKAIAPDATAASESLRALLKETGIPSPILLQPGLKAQLPYLLRVE